MVELFKEILNLSKIISRDLSQCWIDTIKIWNLYLTENNLQLTISGHGDTSPNIPIGVLSNEFLVTCLDNEDGELNETLKVMKPK